MNRLQRQAQWKPSHTMTAAGAGPLRRLGAGLATAALVGASATTVLATATPASASVYLGGVDMQRACNTQYPPVYGLRAEVLNQRNAFSWRCTAPWDQTRGIDVNRECVTQYGGGAHAGLRDGRNPYSWYCQRW
jgi:hypothetical protein